MDLICDTLATNQCSNLCSYESEIPYTATDGHCRTSYPSHFYLEDYCTLDELDDATMQRVIHQHGPAYVVLNGGPLQHYRGGIVNSPDCDTTPDHAVLLVGYDTAQNAWILKNSWSTYWGEGTYWPIVSTAHYSDLVISLQRAFSEW